MSAAHGQPATYGIDPIQFYLEAYFPAVGHGLDVKVGRFFAQYGVESNDATQNALASRAYTFIYDPFTHTGLLTTLKLTDAWSVQSGLVTGSDIFIDAAANPTYIGSVKWAPPGGRDSRPLRGHRRQGQLRSRTRLQQPGDVRPGLHPHDQPAA